MKLLRPLPKVYPLSQGYGEHPEWYPSTKGHMGLDWGCPEGTPITAAANGVVTRAELDTATAANPRAGYGLHVRIQHDSGWTTLYGHFSQIAVKTGQSVKAGEVIGYSGNTGFSTGPHLHFEVRTGPAITTTVNPTNMIVDKLPSQTVIMMVQVTEEGKGLRVRSGPGKEFAELRKLKVGDIVKVMGIAGGDVWLWIDDGNGFGYIAYQDAWLMIILVKAVSIIKRIGKAIRGGKGELS